ncbi:MAG: cysteine desulfurase [Clostridiales bacterium]|nr:cysteine desulfurase [Clostridiales bacterium]
MVYLDNSATTRVCSRAAEKMMQCMREDYFNPSALYAPSLHVEKAMKACRQAILQKVHGGDARVIFTSGGTEADNLAILGGLASCRDGGRVLYSAGEHPAVREACLNVKGLEAQEIPYDREGRVRLDVLEDMLDADVRMICVMQVNNETGAVQPLEEISRLRDRKCADALLHVDGVQGFLRVPFDMRALKVDSYALSGHKIHAPKGVGALVAGSRLRLTPRMVGGGQENNLRSGTENTPGILALGEAIAAYPGNGDMRRVKCYLYEKLMELVPDARVNGPDPASDLSAPHILNISLPPVRSETMLHALEGMGIYVGIGSACSSHKQKVSHTLRTMHVEQKYAESALRFSFCPDNTREEMDTVLQAFEKNYALLSRYQRR